MKERRSDPAVKDQPNELKEIHDLVLENKPENKTRILNLIEKYINDHQGDYLPLYSSFRGKSSSNQEKVINEIRQSIVNLAKKYQHVKAIKESAALYLKLIKDKEKPFISSDEMISFTLQTDQDKKQIAAGNIIDAAKKLIALGYQSDLIQLMREIEYEPLAGLLKPAIPGFDKVVSDTLVKNEKSKENKTENAQFQALISLELLNPDSDDIEISEPEDKEVKRPDDSEINSDEFIALKKLIAATTIETVKKAIDELITQLMQKDPKKSKNKLIAILLALCDQHKNENRVEKILSYTSEKQTSTLLAFLGELSEEGNISFTLNEINAYVKAVTNLSESESIDLSNKSFSELIAYKKLTSEIKIKNSSRRPPEHLKDLASYRDDMIDHFILTKLKNSVTNEFSENEATSILQHLDLNLYDRGDPRYDSKDYDLFKKIIHNPNLLEHYPPRMLENNLALCFKQGSIDPKDYLTSIKNDKTKLLVQYVPLLFKTTNYFEARAQQPEENKRIVSELTKKYCEDTKDNLAALSDILKIGIESSLDKSMPSKLSIAIQDSIFDRNDTYLFGLWNQMHQIELFTHAESKRNNNEEKEEKEEKNSNPIAVAYLRSLIIRVMATNSQELLKGTYSSAIPEDKFISILYDHNATIGYAMAPLLHGADNYLRTLDVSKMAGFTEGLEQTIKRIREIISPLLKWHELQQERFEYQTKLEDATRAADTREDNAKERWNKNLFGKLAYPFSRGFALVILGRVFGFGFKKAQIQAKINFENLNNTLEARDKEIKKQEQFISKFMKRELITKKFTEPGKEAFALSLTPREEKKPTASPAPTQEVKEINRAESNLSPHQTPTLRTSRRPRSSNRQD